MYLFKYLILLFSVQSFYFTFCSLHKKNKRFLLIIKTKRTQLVNCRHVFPKVLINDSIIKLICI